MHKKERARVFGISLAVLLIFSIGLQVVSAQASNPFSGASDFIKNMFADWQNGKITENITKYLFWIIVGIFIFSVLSTIPMIKEQNPVLRTILAVIVSFLSIAYLTPTDLYLILTSYTALGVTLAGILPFVIIAFFSYKMHEEGGGIGRVLSKFVWILFILFLIYKTLFFMFAKSSQQPIPQSIGWVYIVLILGSIVYFLWGEKALVKAMFKEEISQVTEVERTKRLAELAKIREQASALRTHGQKGEADKLDNIAEGIERNLKKNP